MELRLFQLVCLAAAFLTLFVVIPVNHLQNLPWLLQAILAAFGLISLALYWASLRGRHHTGFFTLLVAVVLNLCWFIDGGSQGSIAMFFFAGVMVTSILFRGRRRGIYILLYMADVLVLLTLDHLHPAWAIPFQTPLDRYLDLATGFVVSVAACVLMLWVVIASHDEERRRLNALNQDLQQSLTEIRTLQGLLPICGWCKKIRDDEGLWTQVEQYLAQHTEVSFTHGMCPECAKTHFFKDEGEPPPGA